MITATPDWLRPSALPKLALCGHFRSDPVSSEAAQRGTLLDTWFRDAILNKTRLVEKNDDDAAVNWALDTAWLLAGEDPLVAVEAYLKIECLGMEGTADLLCAQGAWSADLKTGQIRNYREQQAAYALGFMDRFFADEWTVYLLYCDQRQVDTMRFTRENAEAEIRDVLAKVNDAAPPTPNDYCGWCANRFTCTARQEAVQMITNNGAPDLRAATGDQLREFVLRARVVEEYAEAARELLKAKCLAGDKIAGVSLSSKRGPKRVPERVIELHWQSLGTADILAAYGPMSEAKLREIWCRKMGDKPFPESDVLELPGSSFVRVGHPKKQS